MTIPDDADIRMAARDDSKRYCFKTPAGGVMSVPATSADLARRMAASEYPDHGPEDFERCETDDLVLESRKNREASYVGGGDDAPR